MFLVNGHCHLDNNGPNKIQYGEIKSSAKELYDTTIHLSREIHTPYR